MGKQQGFYAPHELLTSLHVLAPLWDEPFQLYTDTIELSNDAVMTSVIEKKERMLTYAGHQ